jgi:hypothetical protein
VIEVNLGNTGVALPSVGATVTIDTNKLSSIVLSVNTTDTNNKKVYIYNTVTKDSATGFNTFTGGTPVGRSLAWTVPSSQTATITAYTPIAQAMLKTSENNFAEVTALNPIGKLIKGTTTGVEAYVVDWDPDGQVVTIGDVRNYGRLSEASDFDSSFSDTFTFPEIAGKSFKFNWNNLVVTNNVIAGAQAYASTDVDLTVTATAYRIADTFRNVPYIKLGKPYLISTVTQAGTVINARNYRDANFTTNLGLIF